MRRVLAIVTVALAVACLGTTLAEGPKYDYVEVGYFRLDPDSDFLDSGDGWFVGGSYGFNVIFLSADYSSASVDVVGDRWKVDSDQWRLAVGAKGLLGDPADLVADVGYVDVSTKAEGKGSGRAV